MASPPPSADSGPPPPSSSVDTFPLPAWLTLVSFIVLVGIFQWSSVLHSKLLGQSRRCKEVDEESTPPAVCARRPPLTESGGGWSLVRLPLAAANVFRVVAFRWTLELGSYDLTMAEFVLTLGYIAFLLAWTFTGLEGTIGSETYLLSWSNHAGLLAASQFPLVTALGTKNNVVSLVTGVSYEKLNFIHRAVARSCFGLLLLHAGAKIYNLESIADSWFATTWVRLGLTAVAALAILVIMSLRFIRSRVYEIFFYTHFIMVLIFLIGAYYHTKETGYSYWIWPSFMFWGLDRLLRLTRVVVFNCFGRRAGVHDATAELLSENLVRLTVRRPSHFQWSPGQAAYLTVPSVSSFPLEAHPFSISSIDSEYFQPGSSGGDRERWEAAQWKDIVFLINIRGGFTKRLGQAAVKSENVKVYIDGPYGSSPDVLAYDTSILVCGGTGVTCTLPLFLSVIEAARRRSGRCRRVVFIWAIRDSAQVQWISEALSRANALTPAWLDVSIRIFVTRGRVGAGAGNSMSLNDTRAGVSSSESALALDQSPEKDGSNFELFSPSSVRMENGRPDIEGILRGEVSTATGRLSVTVCGPQSLTRSVRHALRFPVSGWNSIMNGGPSVTLHVEAFGYA